MDGRAKRKDARLSPFSRRTFPLKTWKSSSTMSFFFQTGLRNASKERFNDTFLGSACLRRGSEWCGAVRPPQGAAARCSSWLCNSAEGSSRLARSAKSFHPTQRWLSFHGGSQQQERESNFRLDCIRNGGKKIKTEKLLLRRVWINTQKEQWPKLDARCFGARWNSNEAVKLPHHATTGDEF